MGEEIAVGIAVELVLFNNGKRVGHRPCHTFLLVAGRRHEDHVTEAGRGAPHAEAQRTTC